MKLFDFGKDETRAWFQQLLSWSRKKVSFQDNLDCVIVTATIGTTDTAVGHSLGRIPQAIIPAMSYPNGLPSGISFSALNENTKDTIWLKATATQTVTLVIF